MSAALKVTQGSSLNPAGIMRGTFDVMVDGKSVGSIKWHSHRTVRCWPSTCSPGGSWPRCSTADDSRPADLDDRCRRPAPGSTQRNAFTRVPLFIVSRKDANVSNQNL
jgi:hypothetical protein